ncbi:MAG TPA: carboxypeptidase-like regulatory domain-containing protein, partial [Niabella sp.]|nr:carboxypeptidase-like regulatory domain-containing protein [Niabella sp.]
MYKYIWVLALLILSLNAQAQKKNQITETFKVLGACEMCKHRIETTLTDNKAVSANWDGKTHLVTVTYDSTKTSKDKLQKKLADAGHDNEAYKADDATYAKLPACCHYNRSEDFSAAPKEKITQTVSGVVLEETIKGKLNPIPNATIKSLHSNEYFVTDSTGVFHIQSELPTHLVISYVGFKPDTISVTSPDLLTIILKNGQSGELKEVVVTANNRSTRVSTRSVTNTLLLVAEELTKAACSYLAESFETSPSVDVSYSDAV